MARDEIKPMGFGDTFGEKSNHNNESKQKEHTGNATTDEPKQEDSNNIEKVVNEEPKNDVEYKGELASVLNREETEKKYKGWNIKVSSIKRLRDLCKDQPKGAETNLVNLIIENALDNIESKGKL
ncbi:hypothetical protein [Mammaliicoccus lentus]|uniref:hypothetical protein n=1 Tax=Mammaliicoccus lentus TaxID=42858 RepID=UPI00374FC173